MKVTLYVKLDPHYLTYLNPEDLKNPEKVLPHCMFSQYSGGGDSKYIHLGQIEIEVEFITPDDILKGAVASLRFQSAEIMHKARQEAKVLDTMVENLLALPAPHSGE